MPPHAGTFDSSNYHPFFPGHLADPYPWWDALAKTTPVCFIPVLNMWAVIGYDYVARVIKDTATLEARVALNVLTKRLPDLELVQGWEPEYLASIVSQGLMTLPVQWKTTGTLNV